MKWSVDVIHIYHNISFLCLLVNQNVSLLTDMNVLFLIKSSTNSALIRICFISNVFLLSVSVAGLCWPMRSSENFPMILCGLMRRLLCMAWCQLCSVTGPRRAQRNGGRRIWWRNNLVRAYPYLMLYFYHTSQYHGIWSLNDNSPEHPPCRQRSWRALSWPAVAPPPGTRLACSDQTSEQTIGWMKAWTDHKCHYCHLILCMLSCLQVMF